MKTLHWINKQIGYLLLFLSSQSGSGFILLTVFLFDLGTNALGIQMFFSERMQAMIQGLGIDRMTSFVVSVGFSCCASGALGLSIMQATMHNRKLAGATLSFMSVVMSIAGLAHVGIEAQGFADLASFNNIVRIVMIISLGLMPPIAYSMNASLIISTFGSTLQRFNEASTKELEKSFNSQVKDLGELDAERVKKQVDKERKRNKRSRISVGHQFDPNTIFQDN